MAVKIHVHEHAGTIILDRPEKRNALSRGMLAELSQSLNDLHQERRVRAVILTGAGPAFCAGMDLGEMLAAKEQENRYDLWRDDATAYQDLLEQLLRFPKPLIAAVNGPAVAGGVGLMLGCDIVLAAAGASFSLPEPRRGLVAGMVAPLLAFRLGGSHAGRLLVSAAAIDTDEARRIGLIHEIVEPDKLWPRAVQVAADCAASAPQAIQATKRMLNETVGEHLATLIAAGAAASATARTTEAAAEGLAAFLEKRPPQWP